jgi:hypothetical protein
MQEFSDPRDAIQRAHETLRRLDDADRRRRFEEQQRAPVDEAETLDSIEVFKAAWDPANPRGLTVKAMNPAEFNAWCDAGRPPLEPPKPAPSKLERQNGMTETQVLAHVTERLDGLVAVLGEEVAAVEKKIRADFNVELAELRAELHELRGERSAGVTDLPDWKSFHVEH